MATTIKIELTTTQQALMEAIAADGTKTAKLEWATQVATDALAAELTRLGIEAVDVTEREAINVKRRELIDKVEAAFPTPEPEVVASPVEPEPAPVK